MSFVLVACVAAGVFVRLGFWQLERRGERASENDVRRERLERPPVALPASSGAAPPPAESLAWRRLEITGRLDPDREMVLSGRSHRGVPGVQVFTPVRPVDGSAAVLVQRGWLAAADGLHADLAAGRAAGAGGATVTVSGIALPAPEPILEGPPRRYDMAGGRHVALPRLDLEVAARALPYPLRTSFYVLATGGAAHGPALVPAEPPALDPGPHLPYAIQWFLFAAVTVVGTAAFLRSEARSTRPGRGEDAERRASPGPGRATSPPGAG